MFYWNAVSIGMCLFYAVVFVAVCATFVAMDVHEHRKKMEYELRDYVRATAPNGQEIRGEIVELPSLLPGEDERQRVAILKVARWDRTPGPRYEREIVLYRTIKPGWKGRKVA